MKVFSKALHDRDIPGCSGNSWTKIWDGRPVKELRKAGLACLKSWIADAPDAKPASSPRHEIHITSDGLTTHAVYKLDGKITKRTQAKCDPTDAYSFEQGAGLAYKRLWDKPEESKPQPEPEYDEVVLVPRVRKVKRRAKVGEWVEIVEPFCSFDHYKRGDVRRIVSLLCDLPQISVSKCYSNPNGALYLKDSEYLVLENYTPAKEG